MHASSSTYNTKKRRFYSGARKKIPPPEGEEGAPPTVDTYRIQLGHLINVSATSFNRTRQATRVHRIHRTRTKPRTSLTLRAHGAVAMSVWRALRLDACEPHCRQLSEPPRPSSPPPALPLPPALPPALPPPPLLPPLELPLLEPRLPEPPLSGGCRSARCSGRKRRSRLASLLLCTPACLGHR